MAENARVQSPDGGLIIQQKWEDICQYIFTTILRDMPKNDKFTLGTDIRTLLWEVEAAIIQLALRSGSRWNWLNMVDVKAKVLLAMIRLGVRIGSIPEKRYSVISAKLVEVGKIVGGLKKVR